jgi:response regulator NasT
VSSRLSWQAPKPRTILVVDDDDSIRATLKTLLEAEGFDVIAEAGAGSEAVELVRLRRPGVVVLDWKLPYMAGDTAARFIRQISPTAKIVAFSAFLENKPEWADAYVHKDRIDELPELIQTLA